MWLRKLCCWGGEAFFFDKAQKDVIISNAVNAQINDNTKCLHGYPEIAGDGFFFNLTFVFCFLKYSLKLE